MSEAQEAQPQDPLTVVDERAASVATAPRITKEFIEGQIEFMSWGTADALFNWGADYTEYGGQHYETDETDNTLTTYLNGMKHYTICILKCKNGFMVTGESAPMSPANFNVKLGRDLAYEDAFRKLWGLFAFAHLEAARTSEPAQ